MAFSQANKKYHNTTKEVLAQVAGVLLILPLAPIICRFIPPIIIGDWNIDLILAFILAILFVRFILWLVKPLLFTALALMFAFLIYNQMRGKYSFQNVANDYKTMVKQNWQVREQKESDQLSINPHLFENIGERTARLVREKVQYKDSVVRNFSVEHSLQYFDAYYYKYRETARYLSLFKYINHHFKYVPDSQRDEYYATPRETILNGLGGDCDDHSILMASCLMSIGARCRLVIVEGHMYPEMYVGNKKDFDVLQQAIVQLFPDEHIEQIFYHENDGQYWINLDYTASYPGGPYMNDKVKLVISLP
jgi:hypothetical protein